VREYRSADCAPEISKTPPQERIGDSSGEDRCARLGPGRGLPHAGHGMNGALKNVDTAVVGGVRMYIRF
jgi:hypothetical protein